MQKKSKILGQVYTPKWIVEEILNNIHYSGTSILGKYILEPSCGDGAFLCEIVRRYIFEAKKEHFSETTIVEHLQTYIYGIEIDSTEYNKCIKNLNLIVKEYFGENMTIEWQIFNTDTLNWYQDYKDKFDFVVGNPPYIRIHNLEEETRKFLKQNFQFSTGVLDIYISFFEMGLKLLNQTGKLGYITPNSFLHNTSYKSFREYLKNQKNIQEITDFKSNKVFDGFSTYTAITILDKAYRNDFFKYKELSNQKIQQVNQIKFLDLTSQKWAFSCEENSDFLANLFEGKNNSLKDFFDIQYGFATLRDKIFIGNYQIIDEEKGWFNGFEIEKSILKKIVKGSRYKGQKDQIEWVLFPYEKQGKRYVPISEEKLKSKYPKAYLYLSYHREELEKRDMDKGALWYEFGRSQGVQSSHKEKIVVSTLVNGSVNYHKLSEDIFVYSGIFITQKNEFSNWEMIENVLNSEDFYKYIRLTGKDFSGGYKSISTKQLKEYKINYNNPLTLF